MRRAKRLDVAVAVIERRGRFLVCQRSADDDLAGYWEFPGGKRKRAESWEACLRREIREELGVSLRGISEFDRFRYSYPEHRVSFRVFRCAVARGHPRPLDACAMRWVPRNRLWRYRFPPANRRLIEALTGRLSSVPGRDIIGEHKRRPRWLRSHRRQLRKSSA